MVNPSFVGRERELEKLQTFWEQAVAGHGKVVFVSGEAGTGKTALLQEFSRRVQPTSTLPVIAIGTCNAHTGIGDPYLPFREILALLTGDVESKLAQGQITPENAQRLRSLVLRSIEVLLEVGPDLVNVLIPGSALVGKVTKTVLEKVGWLDKLEEIGRRKRPRPEFGESPVEQSRIFEQYAAFLCQLAQEQPLILVLDDLQWADLASISLLFHLGRRIAATPLLLIGAYRADEVALGREDERHPLDKVLAEFKRYFGEIELDLRQAMDAEGQQFVDALLDIQPNRLGAEFRRALFEHTEGHPLFTVELLQALQERGDLHPDAAGRWVTVPSLNWQTLPARIEGVIEERIARLEDELHQLLSVASVEGEDFTAQVIARVQELRERQVLQALSQGLEKRHRLVQEQGEVQVGGHFLARYRFVHGMFQHYLYDDLSIGERRLLHGEIAMVLEELYHGQTETIITQLAHHYTEAGEAEKAIVYLLQAGDEARRLYAHQEAISHLTKGLALLKTLPNSDRQVHQELALLIALGASLAALRGHGTPEVGQTYGRARELCERVGTPHQLFQVLMGMRAFYLLRAEHQTAYETSQKLLMLAPSLQETAFLSEAHRALSISMFNLGQSGAAREHLERALALYTPDLHGSYSSLYGIDPAVTGLSLLARPLWHLGYPDQALASVHEALARVEHQFQPYSQVYALSIAAQLHQFRQEAQAVIAQTKAVNLLATKHGFAFFVTVGKMLEGWALTQQGQVERGIMQLRDGLIAFDTSGLQLAKPYYLSLLAEAHQAIGETQEALDRIDQALAIVDKTAERWYEAELHRLRGEALQMQGAEEQEVASCFLKALALARQQEAKSLELRTAISLSRLWQKHKRQQARELLTAVYGWFREGLDTPDLKKARLLLADLS